MTAARPDFLGTLIQAQRASEGFTSDEIVVNAMLLLLAGHIAVRNLVGNVLYLLLAHPEQWAALKADPTFLPGAIEETLRYEPPVPMIPRRATEDFAWQGNTIQCGQVMQLCLASANRDAAHFPNGEHFEITRPSAPYLSFGHGPHGCLGASLAREETRIALETFFRRMPELRLDERQPIQWYRNASNRGPITLPLRF
jgi:cytochrome P450